MSETLIGDYECTECEYQEHNPISRLCPSCHLGEMCYMMTDADVAKETIATLETSRDAWKKLAEELGDMARVYAENEGCVKCAGGMSDPHSPDCPITQLRDLQRREG